MSRWFDAYYANFDVFDSAPGLQSWCKQLPDLIQQAYVDSKHGSLQRWQTLLTDLPKLPVIGTELNQAAVTAKLEQIDKNDALREQLRCFKPWRKGPFAVGDVLIDSEWRSDQKWERLQNKISSLKNRLVLDVGCGNGYYCYRMAGAGARAVMGLDPMLLYIMQYYAIQHFMCADNVFVLPFALEALPRNLQAFDTVFSMGVLYHRRSPLKHLHDLRMCLKPGGELVLETLVIEGHAGQVLVPRDRYAHMKNVWFIPSCALLEIWLHRCGFEHIALIDVSPTTSEEQRVTAWSGNASLADFLDAGKTAEGYPAPLRAIFVASA